jgi:probable phosphoglycerate mutase
MTTFLLVRHAAVHMPPNVLAGRNNAIRLSAEGKDRAAWLARSLRDLPVAAVWTSPLTRALQTAVPIARELNLSVQVSELLNEVDYGEWTGCSFEELERDVRWRNYNAVRSKSEIPSGESIEQLERRVEHQLELWIQNYPAKLVIAITHAEIVRIALLHTLGLSIDLFDRIELSPGLVSAMERDCSGQRVICINESGTLESLSRRRFT